jgi:hypothetical protein
LMNLFFLSKIHIIVAWRRDMTTIFRPIWILIWIYGWRQDCPVVPIEIKYMNFLKLRSKTYEWPVVFQSLDARNWFWALKLQSSQWC